MYEIIATVANLSALTVIGFIYFAYVKNLRSINKLNDTQQKIAEQNIKLWKDKALELERRTPEFIEKQLSERIKIREDEITRLAKDTEEHAEKIELKNREIDVLKESLDKTYEYRKSTTIWDSDEKDFVDVPYSELEQKFIGTICVDTARLMICDPWYIKMNSELEKEAELTTIQNSMYKVVETGELFCTSLDDDNYDLELLGIDEDLTPKDLLSMGRFENIEYNGDLPAIKSSYIKGDLMDADFKAIQHLSFINGRLGAGISISLGGDGNYPVSIEFYKGSMQRIIIDV